MDITPEQFALVGNSDVYAGVAQTMGWGLTHVPEESGALVEAPADRSAILTSKDSSDTNQVVYLRPGVKTTLINSDGVGIQNPAVRKYGIFDNYDGYYWESRNNGNADNFCVVRRTQANTFANPLDFGTGSGEQTADYGVTNPYDPLEARASESSGPGAGSFCSCWLY